MKQAIAGAGMVILSSAALAGAPVGMTPVAGDPVRIASGLVAGTHLDEGVDAYLGIPYAKPPLGDLRWRAPQPVTWQGVWNADRKGAQCIQMLRRHDINHYFGEEVSGEDCLNLNLWKPASAKAGDKLPVIVFIYGGAGTIGSAGMAHYDGAAVARHGALFVNMNYRVGLLGFMSHPELSAEQGGHSGNYGYLDQNAALRWVHDNIAAFGGDPEKVILVGQSFGASSVAAQVMSPLSKGLFRGAVLSSGCNLTREGVPLAQGEKTGLEVQKRLGLANLHALRQAPADQILSQQAESQNLTVTAGVAIPRVMDGYFWPGTVAQGLRNHQGSAVPLIANSNSDDNDALRYPLTQARNLAEYRELAARMYGKDAEAFLRLYPVRQDSDVPIVSRQAAMESGFLAGSRDCAVLNKLYNQQPTYVSLFTRRHPYRAGVVIADQDTASVGAYHNADIPYFFGTLDAFNLIRPTRDWTADDKALSEAMLGSLIAFARTGVPPIAGKAWPVWNEKAPDYAIWGGKAPKARMDLARMDWIAAHPPAAVDVKSGGLRAKD
ncbi:carboxylesterase [Novosphingobium umbonatum]|uniref:Carboxylesterase n=1 Tax=Novosphingobium umbonatum TaxID=1908524 RepID=A0A3S2VQP9_9SPHN|nr:carboxylesterase family protein [Novosphingobium umbonatum]RVU03206.1 carboxylesterase [Novosphingobium umbonatum]